jgi:DinB superfamily
MAILPATPRRFEAITDGLTTAQLRQPSEPGGWSIVDILAHLRACHDVLGGNIVRILTEDHPSWRRLSPRTWLRRTDYPTWDFMPAIEAFTRQRIDLMAMLEPLTPDDWDRSASVTEGPGRIRDRSLRFFGDWLASHEVAHLEDLPDVVNAVRRRS